MGRSLGKPIVANGKNYKSISEFCRQYDLEYHKVSYKLRRGASGDDILKVFGVEAESPKAYKQRYPASIQITIGDEYFNSIAAFCNHYGLKYQTTRSQLRKGKTPEEILEMAGLISSARPFGKNSGHPYAVEIDGTTYPSLVVAADAYGVSYTGAKYLMDNSNKTAAQAIKALAEDAAFKNEEPERKKLRQKCIVGGKIYRSQAEAVSAYGTHLSTVYSRMKRHHLSFEEALIQGNVDRRDIKSVESRAKTALLVPPSRQKEDPVEAEDREVEKKAPSLWGERLLSILSSYTYKPEYVKQLSDDAPEVIWFSVQLHQYQESKDAYVILNSDKSTQDIEIIIPDFMTVCMGRSVKRADILEAVNDLNGQYLGCKLCFKEDRIAASWSFPVIGNYSPERIVMRYIHRFIGSAAQMSLDLPKLLNRSQAKK